MSERTTSPVLLDDATCFRDVSACNALISTTLSFILKDEGHFSENSCKGKAGKKLPFKARKAVFDKLEQIVDIAALSKEERQKYDESIKVYRDSMAVLEYAKQDGMAKGMAKGFAQGIEQGIEQGMKQGIEQGIEQGKKSERLQNARKMIEKGIPPTDIADITGLSLEEINRL